MDEQRPSKEMAGPIDYGTTNMFVKLTVKRCRDAHAGGSGMMPYQQVICSLADEAESARRTAEYWKAEHLAGNAEIERLRKVWDGIFGERDPENAADWVADLLNEKSRLSVALQGVQSCSSCAACRGAATLALGGSCDHWSDCAYARCQEQMKCMHGAAQPPRDGQ